MSDNVVLTGNSVTTQLQQLQQENARLKALLLEKGEGLISTLTKSECLNESEAKFRKLFESHSAVMLVIDPDTGNIIDANQAAASFYGWSVEELQQMSISQINLLSPEMVMQEMEKSRLLKQNRFVFRHRRSDGSVRDVEVFSNKVEVAGKALLYSIIQDITERMHAERELRLSEERFRKLFESHAAIKIVLDPDTGNIVDANRSAADYYGWSVEELRSMNIRQINPLSVDEIKTNHEKGRSSEQNEFEFRHYRSDGSLRYVKVFNSNIEIAGKELLYAIVFDITESKLAEEALHESERKFRTITDQITETVFVTDIRGVLTYASQAIEKIFGYMPQEVVGHLFTEYLVEDEIPRALVAFNSTLHDHLNDQVLEYRFMKKNGSSFFGEAHVHFYQDEYSSGIIGLIRDITERKHNESLRKEYTQELLENRQFLKSIYEKVDYSIFVVDVLPDGSYQYQGNNPQHQLLTGIKNEEMVGKTPEKLFSPQIAATVISNYDACIQGGCSITYEEFLPFMGKESWWKTVLNPVWDDAGHIFRIIGTSTNITQRKLAEHKLLQLNKTLEERVSDRSKVLEVMYQQMIQQDKLVSIGQLAAGIAHELNNPLNYIKINYATLKEDIADLLLLLNEYRDRIKNNMALGTLSVTDLQVLQKMEEELSIDLLLDDIPKIFFESDNGFERVTTIINSMRNFSLSSAPDERVAFDINLGIGEMLILARHEYRDYARIETNLETLLPDVYCNPEQISQVLLNLIVNSAHAIASQQRSSIGKITIRTWLENDTVFCSIADDGPGIPEEIRKNIFNLFFSTKEPGQGIGLGLSICYDIVVHKHGGTLRVESPVEGGTIIIMGFPLTVCPVIDVQPEIIQSE
ncbi:MAG: PAS domain S-box protein [Chlorobiaceae bacterium]